MGKGTGRSEDGDIRSDDEARSGAGVADGAEGQTAGGPGGADGGNGSDFRFEDGNQGSAGGIGAAEIPGKGAGKEFAPDASAPAPAPKRRGRPPGPGKGKVPGTEKQTGLDLAGKPGKPAKAKPAFEPNDRKRLLGSISGIHVLIAGFTKTEGFALSENEAKGLTNSLADVLDKHEINVTGGISVEMALIMAVIMIEGPRVKLLIASRKQTKTIPEPAALDGLARPVSNF